MKKITLSFGSIFAGLAVITGAFATHSLKEFLSTEALSIWQTAVRYQMYHALALILVSILIQLEKKSSERWLPSSSIAFIIGIILFSGSLYSLTLTTYKWLGIITPIGGVFLIIGWICLAIYSLLSTSTDKLS